MSSFTLRCCNHPPHFIMDYEIGTSYRVCLDCSKMRHFARGIKTKKEIGSVAKLGQSQVNTNVLTEASDTC